MRGPSPDRRAFLGALGASLFATRGLLAEELIRTPPMTEGPFYPDKLPLDVDNDLLIINDNITPAVGEVTHLTGRILDPTGSPVRDALIEIWQCDANAVYLHTSDSDRKQGQQDKHFQGYGRFTTDKEGGYRFRTIKPVPYPGRTPHIHYKIKTGGKEALVTQCYIKGHAQNEKDGVYRGIKDARARESVSVEFARIPASKIGELTAKFDVVLGVTPEA